MPDKPNKYDVAFSFLTKDEPLATQLNDRLQDRVKTFIYPERQREVAGTDGEKTLGKVFAKEARLVVVLYRAGWGETPWTRIEETAIRGRAYHHGYTFAKFIPLDDPPTVPEWLPPAQIYIGLRKFGIDGAAAVIEERIRDLGGAVHAETLEERAQRLQRELQFVARRAAFRREPGALAAKDQFQLLKQAIARGAEGIKSSSGINLRTGERPDGFWLAGLGRGLSPAWKPKYFNTLDDAWLEVTLLSEMPPDPRTYFPTEPPRRVRRDRFQFDLLPGDVAGWVSADGRLRTFSTDELAEHLLKFYLEHGRDK